MPSALAIRALAVDDEKLAALENARILYVDDQEDEGDLFVATMHRLGLTADACSSASEALELAARTHYTIFALDVCMPEMDGDRLACELVRTNATASFLLVTGFTEVNLPKRSAAHPPIAGVLRKPWDATHLIAALVRAQAAYEDRAATTSSLHPSKKSDRPLPVLLVEDDDDEASLVERLLERSDLTGLELVRTTRLRDAIRLVSEREFCAIVSELALPDARGLDSVLEYRVACPSVPVVVLSAVSDEALALQAVQEGAQEYLLKSELNTATLQRTIRRAVGRKAAVEGLEQRAERDALTGLYSRSVLDARLRTMLLGAQVDGIRLCLLYLDLDRFKQVNDELGHAAGDEVLKEAAERLHASVRPGDLVVRMGGDEFVVALQGDCTTENALGLGQRIAGELSRPYASAPGIAVSASVGMAFYPDDAQSAEELLEHADRAMYRVKRRAGDDVGLFSEQTREMAVLDDDPDQAVARRITQGRLSSVELTLYRAEGDVSDLKELEPVWRRARAEVDGATLRRVASTTALAVSLHRDLLRSAMSVCVETRQRVLVSLSLPYCLSDGALSFVAECVAMCPLRKLCIGLPQAWLRQNTGDASLAVPAITAAGGDAYLTDFGADGADFLLLSRLPGLRGLCVDGALLRELSVQPAYREGFMRGLIGCCEALSMECLVRDSERSLWPG